MAERASLFPLVHAAPHAAACDKPDCRHPECYDLQPEDVGFTLPEPLYDDGLFDFGGYPR